MSYNLKCPGCNAVQAVGQLKLQNDGMVRCSRCPHNGVITDWIGHANATTGAATPNALPAGTYVAWGTKTKEARGPGLLRNFMEKQADIRPKAIAQPGGSKHWPLAGGTRTVNIYIVKDDVMLKGQYYAPLPDKDGAATGLCMLLLNGSGGSIGHYMGTVVSGYRKWGGSVLAVDYRGIGDSSGRGTAHGLYTDAEVMLEFLTADPAQNGIGVQCHRVVLHGFSIGSAPATDLAQKRSGQGADRVGGLVLHCPIGSFASTASYKQGQQGAGPTMRKVAGKVASWGVGFNNVGKMLHIDLPAHVIYAVNDTFVDPQDAVRLANVQRPNTTTKQAVRYGDHTDCYRIFDNTFNDDLLSDSTLDLFLTGLPRQ